jgi:hypothetical protein
VIEALDILLRQWKNKDDWPGWSTNSEWPPRDAAVQPWSTTFKAFWEAVKVEDARTTEEACFSSNNVQENRSRIKWLG